MYLSVNMKCIYLLRTRVWVFIIIIIHDIHMSSMRMRVLWEINRHKKLLKSPKMTGTGMLHARRTYYTSFPFPNPRAKPCSAVGGSARRT